VDNHQDCIRPSYDAPRPKSRRTRSCCAGPAAGPITTCTNPWNARPDGRNACRRTPRRSVPGSVVELQVNMICENIVPLLQILFPIDRASRIARCEDLEPGRVKHRTAMPQPQPVAKVPNDAHYHNADN